MQELVFTNHLQQHLTEAIDSLSPDRLFILTDSNTQRLCLPVVEGFPCLKGALGIVIPAGDTNKTLASVELVWQALQQGGATRHSLLLCLGGGMVTDLGGFAASTFKRGLHLVNIPTTLLAMVDASVGGKTGFNFGGLKNEIGVFRQAEYVILDTTFIETQDRENRLSGFAEMLKHGLISNVRHLADLLTSGADDEEALRRLLPESVEVKRRIVEEDPLERGIRKALNLGHTIGHAIEALSMKDADASSPVCGDAIATKPSQRKRKPLLHGYAVAFGLVGELWLSAVKAGFPAEKLRQVARFVADNYGRPDIDCDDYPELLRLMTHDKKNTGDSINFTLLAGVGDILINQTATKEEITQALDFLRDGC